MHVIYSLFISPILNMGLKHEFLYRIFFYLPRFINPIFKIGEWINSLYNMHNQEIPWFLTDIKLVFSLFSKKKHFLLAGEINLLNRNYIFFVTYERPRFWPVGWSQILTENVYIHVLFFSLNQVTSIEINPIWAQKHITIHLNGNILSLFNLSIRLVFFKMAPECSLLRTVNVSVLLRRRKIEMTA